jgi:PAS domain S-box-containing protein
MEPSSGGRSFRSRIFSSFLAALLPVLVLATVGIETLLVPYVKSGVWEDLTNSTNVLTNSIKASASVAIRNHLKAVAEKNREIARQYFNLVEHSVITRQQAEARLRRIFLSQTVGSSGYIYCLNSKGIAVVHPNSDVEMTDNTRFAFVRQQLTQKEGYIEYEWQNPGEKSPRAKALYMVYFEPLDWIISVSSYRAEFNTLLSEDDLKDAVLSLKFGKSGYAYVVDKNGIVLIHPKLKGVNLFQHPDYPTDFLKEMISKGSGIQDYEWKNPNDPVARRKLAVYQNIPELGWIIASSAYWDEVMKPVMIARWLGYGAMFLLLIMAALVSYLLSGRLTKPINAMVMHLDDNTVIDGGSPLPVDEQVKELGQLGIKINSFIETIDNQKKALRTEQARYRGLFDSSPDAIMLLDGMNIVDCNPTASALFGDGENSLVGHSILHLSYSIQPGGEKAEKRTAQLLKKALEIPLQTFEWDCVSLGGRRFDAEARLKSFTTHGQDILMVLFVRDLTDIKQTERELADTRRTLETAISQTPSGILIVDPPDVTVRYANKAAMKILEHDETLMFGDRPFRQIDNFKPFMPDGSPMPMNQLASYKAINFGDISQNVEVMLINAEGRRKWISVNAAPMRDENDRITSAIVIFNEITLRKESEEALRVSEEQYRELVQNANSLIVKLDIKGRIIFMNEYALNFFGYTEEEILDKPITGTLVPEKESTGRDLEELITQLLSNPDDFAANENENVRGDGKRVWMAWTNRPIYNDAGDLSGVLCIGNDISERKQLETQLRQAQKMEAVGTLAGGVAHDFNNLLSAIMGYGELAQMDASRGKDNTERLKNILKAADRGRILVRQLLTFSRRSETELKPLDLNQLVTQSANMLQHTIPKMVEIKMNLHGKLSNILGDYNQLEQVIMNMANNASDAMPEGGVLTLCTSLVSIDEARADQLLELLPGKYVQLEITDTGQGMDKKTIGKIFDPFFTTKEIGKGTGLGLSTVYGIVKEHNGHIVCYSELGVGTSFKIYLPIIQSEKEPEEQAEQPAQEIAGGDESILLVDDEAAIRELSKDLLENQGYKVTTAEDGEQALEIYQARKNEIDLIIMDLGMPGMGGNRCLAELIIFDPQVKVIVASGYSAQGRIRDTLDQGAAGFVAKPFMHDELFRTVRKVLDQ